LTCIPCKGRNADLYHGFVLILVAVATPRVGVVRVGLVARTTAPVPVTAVSVVPLILNTLPVAAVSKVLFVNVSVVARPTKVSVEVGKVNVPVFTIVEKIGADSVGLVPNTSTPVPVSSETAVANCAEVIVMVLEPKLIDLLVSVSVVFLATIVSLPLLGNVSTPLLEIEEKLGPTNDGWLSVAPVERTNEPEPVTVVAPLNSVTQV
jgi:hypothetical protein